MKYNFFAEKFKTRLLIFLLVEAVMFIVASALVTIAAKLFADLPEKQVLYISMVIQGVVLFVAAPLLTARLITKQVGDYMSLKKLPSGKQLLWTTLAIFTMTPVLNLVVAWNEGLHLPEFMSGIEEWMRVNEEAAKVATEKLLSINSFEGLVLTVLLVGVLTGIGEEFTFRGVMQTLIGEKSRNSHIAIWVTAIIFSAVHFQFFGFVPRMLLGAFLGYLLVWSGSIWLPVYAHFLNNSMAVLAAYSLKGNFTTEEFEQIGTIDGGTIWAAGISALLLAGCLYKIKGK